MKKEKLKLTNVQVQSFVTKLTDTEKETVKTGEEQIQGTWLISDCILSLRCNTMKVEECYTKAKLVQYCQTANDISILDPMMCDKKKNNGDNY